MTAWNRILICSPCMVTGGPELLHQFGAELRALGHAASICYYPFDREHATPPPYLRYGVPQARFADREGDLVVVPETFTGIARRLRHARLAVWWLSVDNHFRRHGDSALGDLWRRGVTLLGERTPLRGLRGAAHWAQSRYAADFLAAHGIAATMLTDYIADEHFRAPAGAPRRAAIAYNPKKGAAAMRALMRACPQFSFVPIVGLDAAGVRALLESVMIYLDLGHHPGKDRLPREAAMAGCCVVSGRRGSAGNDVDVPIPARYKLDAAGATPAAAFARVAEAVFSDFPACSAEFDAYREIIRGEHSVFSAEVRALFGTGAAPR
jgi:hypothetical protein